MTSSKDIYAVILAGGSGTRFWPMSRARRPKQFMTIIGDHSLLAETIGRIADKVPSKNILVITNRKHKDIVKKQIASFQIPSSNILLEPQGKNTAPAICWAAAIIDQKNKNACMMVFPSDHLILNKKCFQKALREAVGLAQQDYLVTLGIQPTRPETGYGYISSQKKRIKGKTVWEVDRFIEKPSRPRARVFLKKKDYFWNSGMFIFKTSVILSEFKKYLPRVHSILSQHPSAKVPHAQWKKLPAISVDYGILEKAKRIAVVPSKDLAWSDVGSWESLAKALPKDKRKNIFKGKVLSLGTENSLIFAQDRLIATIGLKDIVIVDTPDALLVCKKEDSQQVKAIVSHLQKNNQKVL